MRQLVKFLTATGRRLRILGKVAAHFFRKGKFGFKIAIKIPFFVEMKSLMKSTPSDADEVSAEARRAGPLQTVKAALSSS